MGGKKRAKQLFQKHTDSASKNCWGKNHRKKVRKTFFYIHTNTVTEKWGVKARNNFSRNTLIMRAKNFGKKKVSQSEKTRFLYSHEYRDQEMGGKKRVKQFFQ